MIGFIILFIIHPYYLCKLGNCYLVWPTKLGTAINRPSVVSQILVHPLTNCRITQNGRDAICSIVLNTQHHTKLYNILTFVNDLSVWILDFFNWFSVGLVKDPCQIAIGPSQIICNRHFEFYTKLVVALMLLLGL